MVNAAVEEVSDEGIADESEAGSDGSSSAEPGSGSAGSLAALATYGEDDDAATQLVEPLHSEPRWLVQITPFDRRTMETTALVTEMLSGRLSPSTQVWRDGMHDWMPIERVLDLPVRPSGKRPAGLETPREDGGAREPTARRGSREAHGVGAAWAAATRSPALGGPAFWLANAAVALAVAAVTLGVLMAGGVFE